MEIMNRERWRQIEDLLQSALDLEPDERHAFLLESCAEDQELRREVESLLDQEAAARSFIESPAITRLAESIEQRGRSALVGRKISHYRIESLIGSGGMGDVYRAWDENLHRAVALKMLPTQFMADPDRVQRFEKEALAASKLNHPNIITIFEIIHTAEAHFIVTEFVEGQTLRRILNDQIDKESRPMKIEKAVELAIPIAAALKAAHTDWIVHRDIKPENIMVRDDGVVKILDFGVAKLIEEEPNAPSRIDRSGSHCSTAADGDSVCLSNPTIPGTILGTANYMSPEQARGETLDGRTDIFSLGLVLFEMVTGKRLIAGLTFEELQQAMAGEREFWRRDDHLDHADKGFEQIIHKSLHVRRQARYSSADELLNDLKELKRRIETKSSRRLAKIAVVALVLAMAFVAAAASLSVNDVWEEKILRDGHTAAVRRALISPDGRLLVSVGEDNQVIVWDFKRRERLRIFTDHSGWITALAFSPDGKWFVTAGVDGKIIVWDAWQLCKAAVLPGRHAIVRSIAFSSDGRFMVTPTDDDRKHIWQVGPWTKVRTVVTPDYYQGFFLISPDGRLLVVPTWDTWDLNDGRHLRIALQPYWSMGALSPDAGRLITAGSRGSVAFWDTSNFWTTLRPKLLSFQRIHQDHVRSVAYSPNGLHAASGAEDIILWDALKMEKLARFKCSSNIMSLDFSPDGKWLVSAHKDGSILLWDVPERELMASFNEHSDSVRATAFSADGKYLASAGEDRSIILWNLETGQIDRVLEGHQKRVIGVALSAGIGYAASCDIDGNLFIWDLERRLPRLRFSPPTTKEDRASYCLAISPDGRWVATSFGVYDVEQARMVFKFFDDQTVDYWQIYGIDFSPNGRWLAGVTAQGHVLLWEVATWRLAASRKLNNANLVSVRFSHDGSQLVTGEDQGGVRLWSVSPLSQKSVIAQLQSRIKTVAFSPNGSEVASAGEDQVLSLWSVSRRKLIAQIGTHNSPIYAIAFSPDGRHLISGEHNRSVRLYTRRRMLWGFRLNRQD